MEEPNVKVTKFKVINGDKGVEEHKTASIHLVSKHHFECEK